MKREKIILGMLVFVLSALAVASDVLVPYGALLIKKQDLEKVHPRNKNDKSFERQLLSDGHGKIVNGQYASLGEFPWIVALAYMKDGRLKQYCGGSLIAPEWVVTAGHCPVQKDDLIIYGRVTLIGVTDKDKDVAKVTEVIRHPAFTTLTYDTDIALVRISKALSTNVIKLAVGNPTEVSHSGARVFIAGWGLTEFHGDSATALLKADVETVEFEQCKRAYSVAEIELTSSMFCGASDASDACTGDSGGPAMRVIPGPNGNEFELVGIISFGKDCAQSAYPGVYTRTGIFQSWLAETMAGNQLGKTSLHKRHEART